MSRCAAWPASLCTSAGEPNGTRRKARGRARRQAIRLNRPAAGGNAPGAARTGRRGGYVVDKTLPLPPLNFTPAEMAAIAVSRPEVTPFASAMRSALCKVLAAGPAVRTAEAAQLMDRVPLIGPVRPGNNGSQPRVRLDTGGGLAAVELAIRTAMTRLGAWLLERLLALRLVGRGRDRARGGVRLLPRNGHRHPAGPGQHRPAWHHGAHCWHGWPSRTATSAWPARQCRPACRSRRA